VGSSRFSFCDGNVSLPVKGPYFVSLACFWFLFGMVYFVAHSINRSKVDILKEVKQVQVQVLEVYALIADSGRGTAGAPKTGA